MGKRKQKMCEGCGLKGPGHGLASEGKKRWCAGCGPAEGAVLIGNRKMCLDKRPRGTPGATVGAGAKHGARSGHYLPGNWSQLPRPASAEAVAAARAMGLGTAVTGARQARAPRRRGSGKLDHWNRTASCAGWGARSVRALEVYGGDDTDSDGDEAPRAEGEAAEGAAREAAEEVKAEPAPALGPAIKWEPLDSRRQQQQEEEEEEQPTCVRSAKRRAVWARGAAGGPGARVEAEAKASSFSCQTYDEWSMQTTREAVD